MNGKKKTGSISHGKRAAVLRNWKLEQRKANRQNRQRYAVVKTSFIPRRARRGV